MRRSYRHLEGAGLKRNMVYSHAKRQYGKLNSIYM
jgi:hypothetical protein